jgi:hypothetical protein
MSSLLVDPDLGASCRNSAQPQRRVGGNRALTFDNSVMRLAGTRSASALPDRRAASGILRPAFHRDDWQHRRLSQSRIVPSGDWSVSTAENDR